jgi:hypothetical protein
MRDAARETGQSWAELDVCLESGVWKAHMDSF